MAELNNTTSVETNATAAAPEATKVVLTREEKLRAEYEKLATRIKADTEKANGIVAELQEIAALAAVDVDSVVVVTVGKGDTAREVEATVIGVRVEDDGSKTYKVTYGSGFDADVAVVKGNKIKLPQAAPAEAAPYEAADGSDYTTA